MQFFHGCQFVYEEKYVIKYDLHPLKVVGYEGDITLSVPSLRMLTISDPFTSPGLFGVLTLAVALWPMYFIPIPKTGPLAGISLGPNGR